MKKRDTIKESKDFQKLITTGKLIKNHYLIVYYLKNDFSKDRFGISVGKKIGNAVTRNHYKRQLRNILDHTKNLCSNDKDYIIIIRKSCLNASYQNIEDSFKKIMFNINKGEKDEN